MATLVYACVNPGRAGRAATAPAAEAPDRPDTPADASPPALVREFRGAWVATVANIDWPSRPGLSTAAARAELDGILDRAQALGLNALVFQVRPCGDALYPSPIEPWSEFLTGRMGKAPDPLWDPLQHAIDGAHARGLQLHAWLNPYRASHPKGKGPVAATHVLRKLPDACVSYGEYRWMDPGDPRAATWSLDVVRDLVRRYDLDGLHIDDYFYPYPSGKLEFPDQASWQRYQRGGGTLSRGDWRRHHIDEFVRRMYDAVKELKPHVLVGISPFGIARPGQPAGIQAGIDQFGQLHADVVRWQREGWLDYLAPQLYWPIDQTPQSFATLLPWWHAQNRRGRHVWPGLDANRILKGRTANSPVRADELQQQVALVRAASPSRGHVLFSFQTLQKEAPAVAGALRTLYREPALAPPSPWLGKGLPPAPAATFERTPTGGVVRWQPLPAARFVAVQVTRVGRWQTHAVTAASTGRMVVPADAEAVAVTAVSKSGLTGPATVLRPPH